MTTFSPERLEYERSLVNIMKVLVSGQFNPDFDYAQCVKDVYGLEVSAEDAKFAAMVALREKKADAQRAEREKAYAYFRSNHPLFEFIDDFAGGSHQFYIIPEDKEGQEFNGDFISPEYVKWSKERPRAKNETKKEYKNYLQERKEALRHAQGLKSGYLIEEFICQTGNQYAFGDVEDRLFKLFRNLTRDTILRNWHIYCEARDKCPLTAVFAKRPPRYKRNFSNIVPHKVRIKEIEKENRKTAIFLFIIGIFTIFCVSCIAGINYGVLDTVLSAGMYIGMMVILPFALFIVYKMLHNIVAMIKKGVSVMLEKLIRRYKVFTPVEKIFRYITIIAEVLLILALCDKFVQGFYTFLRFVVCAAFIGLVIDQRVPPLVKVFTIMGAILYNPIVPVHIGDRDVWCVINVLSIPLFIIGECFVYLNEKKD